MNIYIDRAAELADALQENDSFSGHAAHAALAELIANYRATAENGGSDHGLPYDLRDAAALLEKIASFLLPPQDFAQLDKKYGEPEIKVVPGMHAAKIIMPIADTETIRHLIETVGETTITNPDKSLSPADFLRHPDIAEPLPLADVPVSHTYVIGSRMPDGTVSDQWDDRLASAGATPIFTTARILAEFHPQAWVGDLTTPADPEGPLTWDVTDHVYGLGREAALKLRDDKNETDALRDLPNAPEWVRNWSGPFYVEIEQAIEKFYEPLA